MRKKRGSAEWGRKTLGIKLAMFVWGNQDGFTFFPLESPRTQNAPKVWNLTNSTCRKWACIIALNILTTEGTLYLILSACTPKIQEFTP